jgi:hypothetical protein
MLTEGRDELHESYVASAYPILRFHPRGIAATTAAPARRHSPVKPSICHGIRRVNCQRG